MKRIVVTKKKAIVGAIVALLVLVGVGGVVIFVQMQNVGRGSTDEPVEIVPIDRIQLKAGTYRQAGDVDGGLKFFDEQIAERDNDAEKQEILLYKSRFASDSGRADVAVESAKEANEIEATMSSLLALAEMYEAQGDKARAIEYYTKILERSKANGGSPRSDDIWEDKIKELSQ